MNLLPNYLWICNKVHNLSLPKVKFRTLNTHYKKIYQKYYNIHEEDINKITFLIFSSIWITSILMAFLFNLNFVIISLGSFIFAIAFSYTFNSYLFKKILKNEIRLNAILYFIKINFSILKESLSKDSDFILSFINLIKSYKIPISKTFNSILIKIHEGYNPERELSKIITPSDEFNNYIKNFVLGPALNDNHVLEIDSNMLEHRFKVYLHQLETRMSLIFFIGVFFPLGYCFLILFYKSFIIFSIFFLPLFFFLINALFKKLIRNDAFLFGLLGSYNKFEKRKFNEFIYFLKNFAFQLQENLSPESAFINACFNTNIELEILSIPFKNQISNLLTLSTTFAEMIDLLKHHMKSVRYYLILDIIKEIVSNNALNSSKKIFGILNIISNHQKLESKLETVMKGEKFKVFMFLFLLPIIIGTIGGMFPIFTLLIENLNLKEIMKPQNLFEIILSFDFIIIYLTLFACILISSYFLLKTIKSPRINACLTIIFIVYSLLFFLSFYSAISFL